jgi:hypothetical protein
MSIVRQRVHLVAWSIAGIVGVILLLAVVFALVRKRTANARSNFRRPQRPGPDNLNYACAGCGGQFAHSRRTVAAWAKGTRHLYCNVCHKQWRNQQPPPEMPLRARVPDQGGRSLSASAGAYSEISARAQPTASRTDRSGCLTVILLPILVPAGIWLVATYA